jgi:hypothetical protein
VTTLPPAVVTGLSPSSPQTGGDGVRLRPSSRRLTGRQGRRGRLLPALGRVLGAGSSGRSWEGTAAWGQERGSRDGAAPGALERERRLVDVDPWGALLEALLEPRRGRTGVARPRRGRLGEVGRDGSRARVGPARPSGAAAGAGTEVTTGSDQHRRVMTARGQPRLRGSSLQLPGSLADRTDNPPV